MDQTYRYYIRHYVEQRTINAQSIRAHDNVADLLTESLARQKVLSLSREASDGILEERELSVCKLRKDVRSVSRLLVFRYLHNRTEYIFDV